MKTTSIPVASPFFHYQEGQLYVENIPLSQLAKALGTPLYVYSKAALMAHWQPYQKAIDHYPNTLVCYAVKANANIGILHQFAQLGAGFDLVSGGELVRVLKAGGEPQKIIFSGVGKQAWEIEAALKAGIKCFNVESVPELDLIASIAARLGISAPISLRVNPDVDAKTHPYISTGLKENKFGIDIHLAVSIYEKAKQLPYIEVVGVDCHIGSQITQMSPFEDTADKLIHLLTTLKQKGMTVRHLDIGGGVGIRYDDETLISPFALVEMVRSKLSQAGHGDIALILEPGRSLVGNIGVLLTQVLFTKPTDSRHFAIVDAAMNDLIRPTLYNAYHQVLALALRDTKACSYDIVGPICETGDWLAKDRQLSIEAGDYLAIASVGAYGFTMSSQYNTRPRAAEVLVEGSHYKVIRRRENIDDLFALESM